MFTLTRPILLATALSLVAGCATNNGNPYGGQQGSTGTNHTATYGGIGAITGAAAGALIDSKHRGRGALIGAAVGGLAGAGYGYYADKQEAELREQLAGSGVQVQRQGDDIKLIMPGNVTFATSSADISSSFYNPLNNLANSLRQYNQSTVEIVGYTDSTGSYQNNMILSERRAQSVANYLAAQGVESSRLSVRGAGPEQPIASNSTESGRAQNRRVEVNLRPMTQQQQQP